MLRSLFRMAETLSNKRLKMTGPLIGTHSGHFHADEALAVYLLRLLPAYASSPLVRTRDPAVLATCHTVVDVGGEYAPEQHRYDHHQRGFETTFPAHATKLSSAGLVYMHFGRSIIAQRMQRPEDDTHVELIFQKLYDDFVEAVDANDNGIDVYDDAARAGRVKRFKDNGLTLGSLVSDLNRPFADPSLTPTDADPAVAIPADQPQEREDARFLQASQLMGLSFLRKLYDAYAIWLPARSAVAAAWRGRFEVDPTGAVMIISTPGIPWKDHLFTLEAEHKDQAHDQPVLYVLYPESEQPDCKWRVQAVNVSTDSFESRRPLKEEWRGVRDAALSELSGIDGCVFVHASGFIGGNTTKDGALKMALKSLAA